MQPRAGAAPSAAALVAACAVPVVLSPTTTLLGNQAQAGQRLAGGAVIEADLKGGEVHRYDVELPAGTYFALTFDQRGIDVRPAILGPDGATLYDYDFGEWGPEPAAIIAPVSGLYRLEVKALRNNAPSGRYRLQVDAIRPATPDDETRARVMALQIEGYPATRTRVPEDVRRAQLLYEKALDGWRTIGDRFGEAHALTALGFIASLLDDHPRAVALARAQIEIWRELGNEYAEARALRNLGIGLRLLGEWEQAAEALTQSHALHRTAGRASSESLLVADLANSYRAAGDFGAALERAYEAVALARKLGDPQLESRAWAAAGLVHTDLGELEVALDAYRRMRALVPNDETMQAEATSWMGITSARMGHLDAAQSLLEEALAFWTRRNWRGHRAEALIALGTIYLERGVPERARETFELAATLAAETGFARGEAAARRNLGGTLLSLGRFDEAETAFAAAATQFERNPNPNALALVLADQARLALARHDIAVARQHAEDALGLTESLRGRAGSARIHAAMLASSQTVYQALIEVLMNQHAADPAAGHDARALEVSERARARSLLELVSSGRTDPHAGAEAALIDELRTLQRRFNAKAQALDEARSRKNAATTAALSREVDELAAALAVVDARIRRESPALASLVSPEPVSLAEIERDVLDEGTVLIEYLLSEPHSYLWIVSRGSTASYSLAPGSRIEEAARRFQTHISSAPRPAVPERPTDGAGTSQLDPHLALSKLLLEPLRGIPSGRRLLIVAPGVLQNVPFAALPVPGSREPLIARYEIVYAPSASIVGALRKVTAGRPAAARAVAIFADPVFEADDPRVSARGRTAAGRADAGASPPSPLRRVLRSTAMDSGRAGLSRLPFTRVEADAIAALAPRASVRKATGFAANVRAVTDESLADYRIVHFATHGLLDTRTPELSGLVFSLVNEAGRPQDGFLRLHDLGRLRLNAELVVLSGCETGLGRAVEGEGMIGLTRGFMAAGAKRVVASLWKVDDLATAELMKAFYRQMLQRKVPAVAALRAAQRDMAASPRWGHPYFWAGLVIQGEWR